MAVNERRIIAGIVTAIVVVVLMAGAVYALSVFNILKPDYVVYIEAALWVIGTLVITYLLSLLVKRRFSPLLGQDNVSSLSFIIRLVGYVLAFVGLLAFLKVGLGTALAAGGFAGLVLGLASQTVLSNVFGGLMILASRPYRVGDRITVSTWQFGLSFPTYPPKYFSNDYLIPGYTGYVKDISLLYTAILTEELVEVKIPNNIMVQAALFVHSKEERRRVRTRYEVPKSLDPNEAIEKVEESLKDMEGLLEKPSVKILEATQSTLVLGIDVVSRTIYEEPVRSEVIKRVTRAISPLLNVDKGK